MTKTTLHLQEPYRIGTFDLVNRVVMAPMSRMRSTQPGDVPNDLMAEYYAQRVGAGLIITEATQISSQGKGYSHTPGIYTEEQIDGWKKVTEAVHNKNGRIFVQLWHVGRMSHESFHKGEKPVAPSAISPQARVLIIDEEHPEGHMVECPEPRALTQDEIFDIVRDYREAAINAMKAGFDGVEIHGANGYLLDQFLRKTSNQREDKYGGSLENRARLMLEVVTSVAGTIGAEKTALRVAPHIKERGMDDPEAVDAVLYVAQRLDSLGLAYLHMAEADWDDAPEISEDFRKKLRAVFSGPIMAAGNYNREKAEKLLKAGLLDLVAFGRPFVSNPDLPDRLFRDLPLQGHDADKLFGGGREGYIYHPA